MATLRQQLLDAGILVGLGIVAVLGLGPAYGGTRWLVAALAGLLLGTGIALAAARLRLSAWTTMALVPFVYLVLGTALAVPTQAVAGMVPTPQSLHTLLFGSVTAWRQSLTLATPLGDFAGVLIVPFLACLLAGVLGGLLRWRTSRPGLVVLPLAALFVLATAFGVFDRPWAPALRGVVLAGGLLTWVRWNGRRSTRLRVGRRLGLAAAMLAVAGVLAGGLAWATQGAEARQVLRDHVRPPFDPKDYISPLALFRAYPKDHEKDVMLTVHGLPAGARVRVATMDAYDGVVWNVAGGPDAPDGSGSFGRVLPTQLAPHGKQVRVRVTIGKYRGPWVPTVGQTDAVDVRRGPADVDQRLFLDRQTGTMAQLGGVTPGATYSLVATVPALPNAKQAARAGVDPLVQPTPLDVPDSVGDVAGRLARRARTGGAVATALASGFDRGYFSDGLEGQAPSRAGHGSDRIAELLAGPQMIGDAEQYASAMALAARTMQLPARVVMGWVPDGSGTVQLTGRDMTAWVEVRLKDFGWVPFDPTPSKDRAPQIQKPQPQVDPQPQVLQPPAEPEDPKLPSTPTIQSDTRQHKHAQHHGIGGAVLRILLYVGLPLLVLLAPFALVAALKTRRRRRRRHAAEPVDRLAGGWREVVDHATDLRLAHPAHGTRAEKAVALAAAGPRTDLLTLAERADRGVFGPGRPSEEEVAAYWADVDSAVRGLGAGRRWQARLRARFSTASLRAEKD